MTAQEKALDIFNKYYYDSDSDLLCTVLSRIDAIECALIAVDEIEKALTEYGRANDELQNMDRELNYWQKVRKEVGKL